MTPSYRDEWNMGNVGPFCHAGAVAIFALTKFWCPLKCPSKKHRTLFQTTATTTTAWNENDERRERKSWHRARYGLYFCLLLLTLSLVATIEKTNIQPFFLSSFDLSIGFVFSLWQSIDILIQLSFPFTIHFVFYFLPLTKTFLLLLRSFLLSLFPPVQLFPSTHLIASSKQQFPFQFQILLSALFFISFLSFLPPPFDPNQRKISNSNPLTFSWKFYAVSLTFFKCYFLIECITFRKLSIWIIMKILLEVHLVYWVRVLSSWYYL